MSHNLIVNAFMFKCIARITHFLSSLQWKSREQLLKYCLKKVKNCQNLNVKFRVLYDTKCPGCNGCYIGETEGCLLVRITEHGTKEAEAMFKHLSKCEMFKDCC